MYNILYTSLFNPIESWDKQNINRSVNSGKTSTHLSDSAVLTRVSQAMRRRQLLFISLLSFCMSFCAHFLWLFVPFLCHFRHCWAISYLSSGTEFRILVIADLHIQTGQHWADCSPRSTMNPMCHCFQSRIFKSLYHGTFWSLNSQRSTD